MAKIRAKAIGLNGEGIVGLRVKVYDNSDDKEKEVGSQLTRDNTQNDDQRKGTVEINNIPDGSYRVVVTHQENAEVKYLPEEYITRVDNDQDPPQEVLTVKKDQVDVFLDLIKHPNFVIEPPVSVLEAAMAIDLFAVTQIMLGGLGSRRVGDSQKTDVLGVLSLYYGLQDQSLTNRIVFANPNRVWHKIEDRLDSLAKELEDLQSDAAFLNQEAKRQFNLGNNGSVVGNVQFPILFRRYVELGSDSLLGIDLRQQEGNRGTAGFDDEKLEKAYDLLRDLKSVIIQIVRSMSRYGTFATERASQEWAEFEAKALAILSVVADERVSEDQDDKNAWSVLATLTEKNRETEISPYVAHGRHGAELLRIALDIYKVLIGDDGGMDSMDNGHLLDLFQPDGEKNQARRIRNEATVLQRYPLPNWS